MDDPIEDRVAKRGVADEFVQVVDGHFAGDEGGSATAAMFEHFEQIAGDRNFNRAAGAGSALGQPGGTARLAAGRPWWAP